MDAIESTPQAAVAAESNLSDTVLGLGRLSASAATLAVDAIGVSNFDSKTSSWDFVFDLASLTDSDFSSAGTAIALGDRSDFIADRNAARRRLMERVSGSELCCKAIDASRIDVVCSDFGVN